MPVNYKVNGTDLDDIFLPLEGTPTGSNTNFKSSGVDLRNRYRQVDNEVSFLGGEFNPPGAYKTNGVSLDTLYGLQHSLFNITSVRNLSNTSSSWNTLVQTEITTRIPVVARDMGYEVRLLGVISGDGLNTEATDVAVALNSVRIIGVGRDHVNTYDDQVNNTTYIHYPTLTHDGTKGYNTLTSTYSTLFNSTVGNSSILVEGRKTSADTYIFRYTISRSNNNTVNGNLNLNVSGKYTTYNPPYPALPEGGLKFTTLTDLNQVVIPDNTGLARLGYNSIEMSKGMLTFGIYRGGGFLTVNRDEDVRFYRRISGTWNNFATRTGDASAVQWGGGGSNSVYYGGVDQEISANAAFHVSTFCIEKTTAPVTEYLYRMQVIFSLINSSDDVIPLATIWYTPPMSKGGVSGFTDHYLKASISNSGDWAVLSLTNTTTASYPAFTVYQRSEVGASYTYGVHSTYAVQAGRCKHSTRNRLISISTGGAYVAVATASNDVRVFTRSGTTWAQQQIVFTFTNSTEIGALRINQDGNMLIIGRMSSGGSTGNANSDVLIFQRSGTTWSQVFSLRATEALVVGDRVGRSVDITNDGFFTLSYNNQVQMFNNSFEEIKSLGNDTHGYGDQVAIGDVDGGDGSSFKIMASAGKVGSTGRVLVTV